MVSPCLRKYQNTRKNSRGTVAETDSKIICRGCCPPHIPRLVSLSDKRPPDLLVNVMATNDALQSTCLTLCRLNEWFYGSNESTAHYFPTHLLSYYFLLSAYFLVVSCYKRMRLTTNAYSMDSNLCWGWYWIWGQDCCWSTPFARIFHLLWIFVL